MVNLGHKFVHIPEHYLRQFDRLLMEGIWAQVDLRHQDDEEAKGKKASAESKQLEIDPGRARALDAVLGNITKRFGEGSIMRLGEATHLHVETIPTGSLALDLALGVGGIPRGRVSEIYGPESAGKTTLCQHIVAEAQKRGGVAAYMDMEHALDPDYAARCGVDIGNLYISQPDTGEQALEIAEQLVRAGAVDSIVIDSVAALRPKAEIEGEMGENRRERVGWGTDTCSA